MKNNKLRIAFAVIIALIGIGVLIAIWVFRKAPDSVSSQKAELVTDVSGIVNAFMENEQEANAQYLGKIIIVTGTISAVEENTADSKISVTLKEKDQDAGVICEFSGKNIDKSAFVVGNKFKVKGYCTGFLMDVVLNKCVVEN